MAQIVADQKMVSKVKVVMEFQDEIKTLQTVDDGIASAKVKVMNGAQMSQDGYTVMDLTHMWIKSELAKLKHKQDKLLAEIACKFLYNNSFNTCKYS